VSLESINCVVKVDTRCPDPLELSDLTYAYTYYLSIGLVRIPTLAWLKSMMKLLSPLTVRLVLINASSNTISVELEIQDELKCSLI
jgi:hypothetical protein